LSDTLTLQVSTPPSTADAPAAAADPNRPAWLPTKFKSPEDMAAAYSELEKKQGVTPPVTNLSTTEAATTALKDKGLDFAKLTEEYSANGKLTDASMAALTEKGFTTDQVKQFIDGQEAKSREHYADVANSVGGKERFDKLQEFAVKTFSADEVAAYNEAVKGGKYATVKLMLKGLNTQFESTFGKDGKLTTGGAPQIVADVYENFQAYRNAMGDARYEADRNYRRDVDAKLARSTFYKGKK